MNIVLIRPEELREDGTCLLKDRRAEHITQVLGATEGKKLRAGLVNGPLGDLHLQETRPEGVVAHWRERELSPALPDISLLLALPRPKVLKRLYRPLAELGIKRLLLTNAAEVERNYFDTHVVEEAFIDDQLIQGLEQAGHTRLPEVSLHKQLKPLIEDQLDGWFPGQNRILAQPGSETESMPGPPALLAIGPEPGWTAYERALFERHRFKPVSLGPATLKVDTACLALVSLCRFT